MIQLRWLRQQVSCLRSDGVPPQRGVYFPSVTSFEAWGCTRRSSRIVWKNQCSNTCPYFCLTIMFPCLVWWMLDSCLYYYAHACCGMWCRVVFHDFLDVQSFLAFTLVVIEWLVAYWKTNCAVSSVISFMILTFGFMSDLMRASEVRQAGPVVECEYNVSSHREQQSWQQTFSMGVLFCSLLICMSQSWSVHFTQSVTPGEWWSDCWICVRKIDVHWYQVWSQVHTFWLLVPVGLRRRDSAENTHLILWTMTCCNALLYMHWVCMSWHGKARNVKLALPQFRIVYVGQRSFLIISI